MGAHNVKTVTLRKLKMGTRDKEVHVLLVIDIRKGACFTRLLLHDFLETQLYNEKF